MNLPCKGCMDPGHFPDSILKMPILFLASAVGSSTAGGHRLKCSRPFPVGAATTARLFRFLVDAQGRHDVYGMVVAGFRNPWIAGSYVLAVALLGVHLAHAGQSFLQTLGVRYEYANRLVKNLGLGLIAAITVGNLALPVLVFLGFAGPSETTSLAAAGASAP